MSEPKKQFISGAECPACHALDRILMWYMDGVPHRECKVCGYSDRLDAEGQPLDADAPQPLRIVDDGQASEADEAKEH